MPTSYCIAYKNLTWEHLLGPLVHTVPAGGTPGVLAPSGEIPPGVPGTLA